MSQDCTVPQLAGSDLVLWGEVSTMESCQYCQSQDLAFPGLGDSCWSAHQEWAAGDAHRPLPNYSALLHSVLCPAQRLTSMDYIN